MKSIEQGAASVVLAAVSKEYENVGGVSRYPNSLLLRSSYSNPKISMILKRSVYIDELVTNEQLF